MPIASSQADPSAQGISSSREALVEAEFIDLFFSQSSLGIASALISAVALTLLLWHHVDSRLLMTWLIVITSVLLLRSLLIYRYHRSGGALKRNKSWGRANIIGLGLSGCLWAAAIVLFFPSHSLVHQLCLAFVICGVVTGSTSLYAGVPIAFRVFSVAPLLMLILRFLAFPDAVHLILASLTLLYLALMTMTASSFSGTRRQLLATKFELSERVAQRTQALEAVNTSLKNEIQERHKIEARLRQERDQLEDITATIGAGLVVISDNYKILWANRVFQETHANAVGQLCYQLQYHRDAVCETCGVRQVLEQDLEKAFHEQQHVDDQGNPTWFQIVTTPIRNSEGRILAALELVLPITERKLDESARRRMSEQLEEARKTEAIATLAGGIAHQFNNALAVIAGNIELLEYDYRHDAQMENYSRPINNAASRMTQLTNQLLAYAKGGKYKEQPNDLSGVTETTLSLIKHTIPSEIAMHRSLETGLPQVKVDITQIQMVISAIVANAAEAISGRGKITVSCSQVRIEDTPGSPAGRVPPGRYVTLSVVDNGAGMDKDTVQRIFEPFFTTKFQGRGLGMAAVYGIIRNHGGYIEVTSEPGKGTSVCIYLPSLAPRPVASQGLDPANDHGSETVWMIEDDAEVVAFNRAWLHRMGYGVLVAASGEQATEMLRQNKPFDVVLLDLALPDMSGAALYPLIRKHRPSAKVIVCSGYGLDEATQQLLDEGADGYIQKPYSLSDIHSIIVRVLKSEAAPFRTGALEN
jgi:two-component system, cell cycle sensor histidine kinase and response regulator CckA